MPITSFPHFEPGIQGKMWLEGFFFFREYVADMSTRGQKADRQVTVKGGIFAS